MKSKFNFKSLSRAATLSLSLSLLASAKSFASDAFVLGEDSGKPAMVVLCDATGSLGELNIRSLENGVLTSLGGMNITRTDRTVVVSGTAENDLFINAPDFNVIAGGVIRSKQLHIFAKLIVVRGEESLDSTSITFTSGADLPLDPAFVAPSMCATISVACQDFASGFMGGLRVSALAVAPVGTDIDSSDED